MLIGRVLGPTEVEADGTAVDLGGPLPRRLVTVLLAADGRPVGEEALTEAIWDGSPPASPGVSLQAYVSRLRRSLGRHRDALQRAVGGYRLAVAETDAARFAAGVEQARAQLAAGQPALARRGFDTALTLWRGVPYADLPDAEAAAPLRARFEELHAVAVEERLAALLAVGDAPGATGELQSAVRREPYRERRWQLLVIALYRSGRQADALAAMRQVRARLADDLGIDPGPALQELESRLLAQDPSLLFTPATAEAPHPTATIAPAFEEPRSTAVPQVAPAFAALAPTASTTALTPAGLAPPAASSPGWGSASIARPLTHFLGRADEMALLTDLIRAGRLVTLVGPGGAGKTRLAVEFSAAQGAFAESWLVRLADVSEPELVPETVAVAAGVRGPTPALLGAALADRTGLLVLDNCEHLTGTVAELVIRLLVACPGLRVLATSREPLGVDGERTLPLGPLPPADAVALLTDRVAAIRPGWRPSTAEGAQLAGIAAALDGIPLALELAAARARVLGLGELLDMLGDRFPALGPVPRGALAPHRTLEATIAWSVDLLAPADRALLLRLWPFEGGFTLAAVDGDVAALSALVTRSVVVADTTVTPSRYRLLELVRAYCRERDPDPAASRAQHAAWVRELVERYAPQLRGEHSAHAIRVLNRELANLRTGIAHDVAAAPAAALRTAGLLEWFWYRGGHVTDGLRLLRAALAAAPDAPATDRARAWLAQGTLHFMAGDLPRTEETLTAGLAALGEPADWEGRVLLAQAAYYEALLRCYLGDFAAAAGHARRSQALSEGLAAAWIEPMATVSLGFALAGLGEVAEGRRLLTEVLERGIRERLGWPTAMCALLLGRARLAPPDPDPAGALAALRQARDFFGEQGDVGAVMQTLHAAAYALVLAGRPADGATLLAAVRARAARQGWDIDGVDPNGTAAVDAALRAELTEDDRAAAERAAARLSDGEMLTLLD